MICTQETVKINSEIFLMEMVIKNSRLLSLSSGSIFDKFAVLFLNLIPSPYRSMTVTMFASLYSTNDPDTTQNTTNTDEAIQNDELCTACELLMIRAPTKNIYRPSQEHERIKTNLIRYVDNGDFDAFDSYSMEMIGIHGNKGDFDIVVAVTVEQARCFLYRNDLKKAKAFALEAHELASHTRSPQLFHAQAHLVRCNVSRYKNKLGDTKKYLDLAKQCLESSYSSEDLIHYHEYQGSYLDKLLGACTKVNPIEPIKNQALIHFKRMNEIGLEDSNSRVSSKTGLYANMRMGRILLDSNWSFGRLEREVTQSEIDQASECIDTIKRDHLASMPRGSMIQFQMVESDLYYRQKKFPEAKELLEKSLHEARMFGFSTEEPKIIQVRIVL